MEMDLTYFPGQNAVGVVDFNATAGAADVITINGVEYAEADTADAENGVFTNGSSAANSATSFAAAVNGDTRGTKPPVTAVVSTVGDSVFLIADYPGTEYNYVVTTDSSSEITVENLKSGRNPGRKKIVAGSYVVTDQDVLADQVMIALPFAPTGKLVNVRTTAGVIDAVTVEATIAATPNRLKINFAGATDPIAGDVIDYIVFE
jgi:hypothetical protein